MAFQGAISFRIKFDEQEPYYRLLSLAVKR